MRGRTLTRSSSGGSEVWAGAVSWHYDGPVDCELLGREDVMEELEDCFCVMTSA